MRDVRGDAGLESGSSARAGAASYEEFVATRGPALFRTAYLLAGDRVRAAELLQVALVRLHLAWRRARHAESTEAFATGLLVTTFTTSRLPSRLVEQPLVTVPEGEPDPDPADRLLVWPHLVVLEPRQRAVVVLGSTQAWGDHQIAALVGVSPRSAATAGRAGLAALAAAARRTPRDVRDRLGAELREVAETRPLPELAVEALARLAAAESVRRRKRLLAAVTVAAALVVAVGVIPGLLGSGDTAPAGSRPQRGSATEQLTSGPGTTLPWWSGGELHVDGRVVPTNHDQVVSAGGTTLVGDVYVGGFEHLSSWWIVTPRGLVPLVTSTTSVFTPSVSPDGRLVAWAEPRGHDMRLLVLWDARRERAGGRLAVRVHPACCGRGSDLVIRGVDTRGQVFFDSGGPLRVWRPGERARTVRGISGGLYQVNAYPDGIAWQAQAADPLGPFPISYGWVDDQGRVHRAGSLPNGALWSPDGGSYAFVGEHQRSGEVRDVPDEVWVADALHSRLRRMRLPGHASYQLVGWESPTSVVVAVRRDTGRPLRGSDLPDQVQLLRCHAPTAACETAGLAPQAILGLSPYY